MAAKHQHYVPRLLLRGFLSQIGNEADKERVRVFDLEKKKLIITSIDNMMGEGRFNEWWVDEETIATIDPSADAIETQVASLVARIRQERTIGQNNEVIANLALLMAFQFIRTKKMRLMPEQLNKQIRNHVKRMGLDPDKIDGLVDWDENKLKAQHAKHQIDGLQKYTEIMVEKVYFVMSAPEGSSFYLSDHPVVLHTDEKKPGVMRGLGIGVPYIQIYLPLSADVMLCAYDRAVLGSLMRGRDEEMDRGKGMALKLLMDGRISAEQMKDMVERAKEFDEITPLIEAICSGGPVVISKEQVDAYNSLQVFHAHRFVVDPSGGFELIDEIIADREAADNEENSA